MTNNEASKIKKEVYVELKTILDDLKTSYPIPKKVLVGGVAVGCTTFWAASQFMFSGLSAAGITSTLKIVGGGMVAGIGVIAAIPALGAVAGAGGIYVGYKYLKKRKNFKKANEDISRLLDIKSRLIQNAEHFQKEITDIDNTIEALKCM